MRLFKCPACGDEQRALASSVVHLCPARVSQAAPAKGKHKLPEYVEYQLVGTTVDILHAPVEART